MLSYLPRFRPVLRAVSCLGGGLLGPGRVAMMAMAMPSALVQAMALSSAKKPVDGEEEKQSKPNYIEPTIVRNMWTPEEDTLLREGVAKYGNKYLLISSSLLPHRSRQACRQRWTHSLNPTINSGPWSAEEDAQLTKVVGEIGTEKWADVVQQMGGRMYRDCLQRWTRVIDPSLKKGNWTDEEDAAILAGVSEYGRKWATVRGQLLPGGRCRNDIAHRYRKLVREKVKWNQWSDDEDSVLREVVEQLGTRDWGTVAAKVKSRNAFACKNRWCHFSKNKTTGAVDWNEVEDDLLAQGVQKHGTQGKWAAIAATIPGKAGRECKVRWERNVFRDQNKAPWTKEEDAIIVKMREDGRNCDRLFYHLPGRDKDAIRKRCKELGCEIMNSIRWTDAEVEALKKALLLYEGKRRNWKNIAEQVPGKTAQQCESVLRTIKL